MKETIYTIVGDSISKGMKIENGRPKMLDCNAVSILQKHYNVKIDNISFFGQTIGRVLDKELVENYIKSIDKKKKNVFIFALGGNDSDYNWSEVAQNPTKEQLPKTKEQDFFIQIESLIKLLKKQHIKVWICGLPPVNANNYFNNIISKNVDGDKVMEFYEGDVTNIYRHQELYNTMLFKLANKYKCLFLDIRTPFLRVRNSLEYFCEDGIHPNEKGQKLIAEHIINILEKNENGKDKTANFKNL